jgi:hypothetical protein
MTRLSNLIGIVLWCSALAGACGTVTVDPPTGAGGAAGQVAQGGAVGQLATGGQGGAGDVAGATGGVPGGTGGAGGAGLPNCGVVDSIGSAVNGSARCFAGCFGQTGLIDAGVSELCVVAPAQAAQFTNAPGPIYCWQSLSSNAKPPAACY